MITRGLGANMDTEKCNEWYDELLLTPSSGKGTLLSYGRL